MTTPTEKPTTSLMKAAPNAPKEVNHGPESIRSIISRISLISLLCGFEKCEKLDAKMEWAKQRLSNEDYEDLTDTVARLSLNLSRNISEPNRELSLIRAIDCYMKAIGAGKMDEINTCNQKKENNHGN